MDDIERAATVRLGVDDIELAKTIELRLAGDLELAETLVKRPRATIEPFRHASSGGEEALGELRRVAGGLDGKIALLQTLGEGGMGVVHLATQATLGRHVAVKTLRAGVGGVDATLRILREAWVTGLLEHPNIIPIYDVGVDAAGSPVIVMKRVEGRSWQDLMRDPAELTRLLGTHDPLEASVRVLLAVCNAVHFAHSRGILHRDLKPENVMIGSFGEVYVLDWGIAISLRDDPSGRLPSVSQATDVAGTPSYMAPEMLLGDPAALSVRTDVYLLGAIFYEIFTGEPPHGGNNLQAMIASVLLSEPKFRDNFPAEARGICQRAMGRDPASRHGSVEEFREAVDEYLRHRGSRRLAWEARRSLNLLLDALASMPPGEERTLAVFNLLGECRFGYRAALEAWPGNEAARRGLDRALLSVVDHELAGGDPAAASSLLREVADPPPDVAARVAAAAAAAAAEDERLRRLEQDLDPTIGTRTRTVIGAVFGLIWTTTPLVSLCAHLHSGYVPSHPTIIASSAAFLSLGAFFRFWAQESMTKTLVNRRIGRTLGLQLGVQMLLGAGAWLNGLSPEQSLLLHIFSWALTEALLAVWVDLRFAISASLCALSFLVISAYPGALYPLMALDNLVLTVVLVRIWLPRQDIARVHRRRDELHRRARKLFLNLDRGDAGVVE